MKHVETLAGMGTVTTADGRRVRVEYELDVLQDEVYVGAGCPPLPGMKEITGRVTALDSAGRSVFSATSSHSRWRMNESSGSSSPMGMEILR